MNTSFTSTQKNTPLTVGSLETFQGTADLNGSPWDLTNGTAILKLEDQSGNLTSLNATIMVNQFTVNWTVTAGNLWTRTWTLTDASGVIQVSRPYTFPVEASPP